MIKFEFSKEEIRDIHNAKCDLYFAIERIKGVLSPDLLKHFNKSYDGLEKAMRRFYSAEQAAFDAASNYFTKIQNEQGFNSIWSVGAPEVGDMFLPHPYKGARVMKYMGNTFEIDGDRWIDLWRTADDLIASSGDDHHIFIENFTLVQGDTLELSTGS